MARIVLIGGPTPGPLTIPATLPPPYFDSQTESGTHRYTRTETVRNDGRIVYVTGEMVLKFGELPPMGQAE